MSQFCGPGSNKTLNPTWYDPLGPKTGPKSTGAAPLRTGVFDALGNWQPQATAYSGEVSNRAAAAANNPGYASAAGLANRSLAGDYLHGTPELDRAIAQMRTAAGREAGDATAAVQDQFARNGVPFSTANQQAAQAAQAASTARAGDTEAQMRLANYQDERNKQLQAVNLLDQAQGAPLNYLDTAASAPLGPLTQVGQILAGLSGNGQLVKPDILNKDTWSHALSADIGAL